jgi:hypothetical protein
MANEATYRRWRLRRPTQVNGPTHRQEAFRLSRVGFSGRFLSFAPSGPKLVEWNSLGHPPQ